MRHTITTAIAAGACALMFTTLGATAADGRKLDNAGRLDWLELRTLVASTDGPVVPNMKTDRPVDIKLGLPGSSSALDAPDLERLKRHLTSAWSLVQQQAEFAAKLVSKRTDQEPAIAARNAPELSWGWQHAS